jgi:hypothetical protein
MPVIVPFLPYMMMAAVATTGVLSAASAKQAGAVQGDTAMANAKLQQRELISQAQMSEREAQSLDYDAQDIRATTAFDVTRQQEQGTAFKSQQVADVAASGLEASGSPLLVMSETAKQIELDKLAIEHGGEAEARRAEDAARLARYQAGELRKGIPLRLELGRYQAKAARASGNIQAASSIIGAGAKVASIYGSTV